MSKTHTAKALAFCATPGLIIIAYSRYLRKNRLNQRRLFGAACSSGTLAATRSSPSESCCWIVPAWRACAARAVSCAANNAVLHSANLAFNSLICSSFTANCLSFTDSCVSLRSNSFCNIEISTVSEVSQVSQLAFAGFATSFRATPK